MMSVEEIQSRFSTPALVVLELEGEWAGHCDAAEFETGTDEADRTHTDRNATILMGQSRSLVDHVNLVRARDSISFLAPDRKTALADLEFRDCSVTRCTPEPDRAGGDSIETFRVALSCGTMLIRPRRTDEKETARPNLAGRIRAPVSCRPHPQEAPVPARMICNRRSILRLARREPYRRGKG